MQLGLVIGCATATVRHPSMASSKLLVVQPLAADERSPDGEPVLAIDRLGAGRGEMVVLTSDGRMVRELLDSPATPVRYSVMGLRNP